jgi:hypothetical protein
MLPYSVVPDEATRMRWLIMAGLLPICFAAMVAVLRGTLGGLVGAAEWDRARNEFRLRREWLEARFLHGLAQLDPSERRQWERANWHDEVTWARDRQTGRFLALVEVHFDPDPDQDEILTDSSRRHATVVFEYVRGQWRTDGRRLDELSPHETFLRNFRYERVPPPPKV